MKSKTTKSKTTKSANVDWNNIRERLARAARATDEAQQMGAERARTVLEERARALALPPAGPPGETVELLIFALGGERFAFETRWVREVFRLAEPTPLPGAPSHFAGVTNLRGLILPVVDFRKLVDLPGDRPDLDRVIVLGAAHPEVGLLADTGADVVRLQAGAILDARDSGTVDRELVRGVTADALIVLDAAALLQDPRLIIDQSDEN